MSRNQPPNLAKGFLQWFCKRSLFESIAGDLDEEYHINAQKRGSLLAGWSYYWNVIRFFRPGIIRNFSETQKLSHMDTLRNNLKIAWRSLMKQKVYTVIKIGGFSIGIAACLLISLYIQDELSYDDFYQHQSQLYRVIGIDEYNGKEVRAVWFPAPFAKSIQEDFPEIEEAGRFNSSELFGAGSREVRRADQRRNYHENRIVYFDQNLLNILQPTFIAGDPRTALDEPNTIVITKSRADKYFPNENALGKSLVLDDRQENSLEITGVIEDFPKNSHLDFQFFITMTGREFWQGEQSYWRAQNYITYVKLQPGTDPMDLAKKMKSVVEKYIVPAMIAEGAADVESAIENSAFYLQPIKDIHLKSADIYDIQPRGDIKYIWLFGAIAVVILVIASINFVNLATAKSANRAKEVGLRKTMGSSRPQLVLQFLTESNVYALISFIVGTMLAWSVLSLFNELANKTIDFPWNQWEIYPLLVVSSLIIGSLSGIYPAFYLSAFEPSKTLKGNLSRGNRSARMRSILVITQFAASIILMICTVVIYQQMNFVLKKDLGFNKDQVLILKGTSTLGNQVLPLKSELLKLADVSDVAIGDYLPVSDTKRDGNSFFVAGRSRMDPPTYGQMWTVDDDFINTMGMRLVSGRSLDFELASDSNSIVINEEMAKRLSLEKPLASRIENYERPWKIVGVLQNFHYESMKGKIEPLAMKLGYSSTMVSVKTQSNNLPGTLDQIESVWKEFAPNQPIRYDFLDDRFALMYKDLKQVGRLFNTFAVLAILVACLGLFALSAYMVEQRTKELSIRKALGASLVSLFQLLTKDYLKLVIIAFAVATPFAWYFMEDWLTGYEYRTHLHWSIFLSAGLLSSFIAIVTISFESIKAGFINPAEGLRSE